MFTLTNNPMTLKQVFGTSYHLYRQSFKAQIGLVAIMALLANILNFMPVELPDAWRILITCVAMAINVFFQIAVISRVNQIFHATSIVPATSLMLAREKWLHGIGLAALTLIPIALGFVLFVVPGLFLYVLFFFVFPEFVIKNRSVFDSIKNSCELVWGQWWRTFGIILLAVLIPIGLLEVISVFTVSPGVGAMLAHGLLQVILLTALFPWLISLMIVLFHDAQMRAEKKKPVH